MHMAAGCESFDQLAEKIGELTKPEGAGGGMEQDQEGDGFFFEDQGVHAEECGHVGEWGACVRKWC